MNAYPEFVTAIRVAVALVFLVAAVAKLKNLATFAGVVANYRLLPAALATPFAYGLPPLELLLGVALLAGAPGAEWVAAGLLVLFAVAMGVNIARGRAHIDCGCFNSTLKQPLKIAFLARNTLLAVLLLLAANAGAPVFDGTLLLGMLGGLAVFTIIQGLNAVLAIPPLKRRHAHG